MERDSCDLPSRSGQGRGWGICRDAGLPRLTRGRSQGHGGGVGHLTGCPQTPPGHPTDAVRRGRGWAGRAGVKPGPARDPRPSHGPGQGTRGPKLALAGYRRLPGLSALPPCLPSDPKHGPAHSPVVPRPTASSRCRGPRTRPGRGARQEVWGRYLGGGRQGQGWGGSANQGLL